MLFATFISSFVQLGIALLIPAIWWAVTTKRRLEFATWIGLYVPTWKVGPVQRVSQKQLGITEPPAACSFSHPIIQPLIPVRTVMATRLNTGR